MKKIKMVVLMSMLFIISGCSADYNLIVTSDQKVKENVKLYMPNKLLPKTEVSIKEYFQNQINSYSDVGGYKKYEFSYKIGDEVSYVQLDAWHKSFNSYQKSIIYNNLFENVLIMENSEYITFETVGKYFYSDLYSENESPDPNFYMGDIIVKIRLHNKVLDSNADNIDEKNNTLEWKITSEDEVKSIFFKSSHEKRYDIILIDMIMLNKNAIITISLTIVVVAGVAFYFYNRYRKNNSV